MRVLVVEDDPDLGASLRLGLEELGIRTDVAATFGEGRLQAALGCYDVLVLDVRLPGGSGLDLCRRLRASGNQTPILILTAQCTEDDRVRGLELGADDYLAKPFSFRELVARLRALSRRMPALPPRPRVVADLTVDLDARTAQRAGQRLALTTQEWALLEFFVRHEGTVVDRSSIIAYVWDANHDPLSNLLEVLIWRLRRKVDDPFEPKLIHTVRGAGYRFGL
jgi:two-component system copper resistance phosphate regulon response regulator CusR